MPSASATCGPSDSPGSVNATTLNLSGLPGPYPASFRSSFARAGLKPYILSKRLAHSGVNPSDLSDQPVTYVGGPLPANTHAVRSFRVIALLSPRRTFLFVHDTSGLKARSPRREYCPPR